MKKQQLRLSPLMHRFSTLSGPISPLPDEGNYSVKYKPINSSDNTFFRYWSRFIAISTLLLALCFAVILFEPQHWLVLQQHGQYIRLENLIMLMCLAFLQLFVLIGTLSATRATLIAKNPVPTRPLPHTRVAFVTTRAPGEPIELVIKTLQAALNVRHKQGHTDVWLLDETRSQELIDHCEKVGVKYFSRKGIPAWNTVAKNKTISTRFKTLLSRLTKSTLQSKSALPNPFFAIKSKHGNFNAWMRYLKRNKVTYDLLAGVDTDHVPFPNYLERTLGYFRDPNVAYVVGPQVYGNFRPGLRGLVARWSESQASFFQSTIQRAGNNSRSPMFVGTNYVIRMSALNQVGGFQPCITEDMATGLAIHSTVNPNTGIKWQSVYTPDVLAIGEGPDYWEPYFRQQWRWAAGTFDTWRRSTFKTFYKLPPRALFQYLLILTFYPMTALTWLLAFVSSMVYLLTGATAIIAPWGEFASLYLMMVVMQLSLYFWNRRYNVSPHETEGSFGIPGMLLTSLSAPIYLSALVSIIVGKKSHFVVTTKSQGSNPDWFGTFRLHIEWAVVIGAVLIYGIIKKHNHFAMLAWALGIFIICCTPIVLGMAAAIRDRLTIRKQEPISLYALIRSKKQHA